MRKQLLLALQIAMAGTLLSCASAPQELPVENRLILAVASVEGAPAAGAQAGEDILIAALAKSGRLRVMERSRLDALLKENELALSDLASPGRADAALAVLGVDAVLLSSVTGISEYSGFTKDAITGWWDDVSLGIEVSVAGRIASIKSSEILATASASAKAAAGTFFGAMGQSTVTASREDLQAQALSEALKILADRIARGSPQRP
jgi:curli biogenesis system outer membrane secretion channel CsgG